MSRDLTSSLLLHLHFNVKVSWRQVISRVLACKQKPGLPQEPALCTNVKTLPDRNCVIAPGKQCDGTHSAICTFTDKEQQNASGESDVLE